MKPERFEAYTDAVIAIIATLLVLEIKLPDSDHSVQALIHVLPNLLAYIGTFIFISSMWINHHRLFQNVKKIDNKLIWINMLYLFFCSLLPATTAWLGTDLLSRVPLVLYFCNILSINLSLLPLRRTVFKSNPDIDPITLQSEWISLGLNSIIIIVAFFQPVVALILFILHFLLWVIPNSLFKVKA